ncbi:hypothetical protein BASA81_016710 [Batrachochytrium salamandrivorans]|nr:hypothetical protein BASA81_016710 [Batrachochytrium salamandrivorans]
MHLTILLVLIAAAVYGYPTQESQTPPGDVSKPGRSGKDLWKLQRILLRAIHSDSRPSRDSVYQWFNPNAGLNSAAIAGMQITASIPSVNLDNIPGVSSITCNDDKVTMVVSSIVELADWELQKILLLIDYRHKCQKGDEAKFVMLVATSWTIDTTTNTVVFDTKDPQAEGVTGSYVIVANPVKLVASARAALTAAISVDLELLVKMPKFFTKLSASEKVAQYPIEPEYSVSASATALVSGETKFAIGPQLALNVFTKEYKTLMFDEPPAEVVSIESAVKLSAQAIKHAIEHPL